jgi:hypothetical protein
MREDWRGDWDDMREHLSSDLESLRSSMGDLDRRIRDLEARQTELPDEVSDIVSLVKNFAEQFDLVLGKKARFILSGIGLSQSQEEKALEALHSDQITLAVDRPTREQLLSVMDIIKRVSQENDGRAPKEEVLARTEEIKVPSRALEEILARLRRSGALEMEGDHLRLI